eukprot:3537635-Rhodomonas_salina.2
MGPVAQAHCHTITPTLQCHPRKVEVNGQRKVVPNRQTPTNVMTAMSTVRSKPTLLVRFAMWVQINTKPTTTMWAMARTSVSVYPAIKLKKIPTVQPHTWAAE